MFFHMLAFRQVQGPDGRASSFTCSSSPPADLHVIANSMQPHGDGVSLMLCTSSKASWFLNHALLLSELLHARPFKDGGGGDHMPLF